MADALVVRPLARATSRMSRWRVATAAGVNAIDLTASAAGAGAAGARFAPRAAAPACLSRSPSWLGVGVFFGEGMQYVLGKRHDLVPRGPRRRRRGRAGGDGAPVDLPKVDLRAAEPNLGDGQRLLHLPREHRARRELVDHEAEPEVRVEGLGLTKHGQQRAVCQ